jgi:hypothetical protein
MTWGLEASLPAARATAALRVCAFAPTPQGTPAALEFRDLKPRVRDPTRGTSSRWANLEAHRSNRDLIQQMIEQSRR